MVMENEMESDTQVSYSAVAFDFEQSLWDNVVLDMIRQGQPAHAAVLAAKDVIEARRNMFNDKENK